MKTIKIKWGTYEDDISRCLELNARMLNFLSNSELEILHLAFESSPMNFSYDGTSIYEAYNGSGSFNLLEEDALKFDQYFEENFKLLNPDYPDKISILVFESSKEDI